VYQLLVVVGGNGIFFATATATAPESARLTYATENQFIFTTESARLTHRQVAAFIWFDVFSYRQHDIPQDSSAQTSVITLMSEVVAKTGSLALMLHPFDNPLSLKRAWCVRPHTLQTLKAPHGSHQLLMFCSQVHLRTVLLRARRRQVDRHADARREGPVC
jgi:hypothetical protein